MKFAKYLTAIAAVAALTACNDIGPEDRFIELPPVEAQRVVLLEEFTGQFCVNCPAAHKVIENLVEQYPDNLIPVSIHAGGDAFSIGEGQYPGVVGLRLPEGEAYAAAAGATSFPCAMVDRTSGVTTSDQWASLIRSALQRPSSLEIDIIPTLDTEAGTINIVCTLTPHANLYGTLQLWIVENGITALQLLGDGSSDLNYEHNHVFRAAVNGTTGQQLLLTIREPQSIEATIALKPNWNPANLSVVAFFHTPTLGVEQAALTPLP